jgi:4-carboxymuconolactone decarboxylase
MTDAQTRPTEPRLAPLADDELDEDQRAVLQPLIEFRGMALNIFRTFARHPRLLRKWLGFGTQVLMQSSLPARERELVILRTAWNCQAVYEWGHHVEIGLESGVTHDDIERIPAGPDAAGWADRERHLLRATDELHHDQCITDGTWTGLQATFDEQQLLDLVFLVGQYHLVSMALNSFGVPREEGVPGFPA